MSSKKIETIYVSLDVLLDTRIGTIAKHMGHEVTTTVLSQGYVKRDIDTFHGVDAILFKQWYQARDVETLQNSTVTGILPYMRNIAKAVGVSASADPYFGGVNIAVNVHPYVLSPEELLELGNVITVWIGAEAKIELVNINPNDLTPKYCLEKYVAMFMYEFEHWMNVHSEAFRETQLNGIQLIAPALYCEKPSEDQLKELIKEAAHPFQATEMYASPLVGLKLIDAKYFSIVEPPKDIPA